MFSRLQSVPREGGVPGMGGGGGRGGRGREAAGDCTQQGSDVAAAQTVEFLPFKAPFEGGCCSATCVSVA